MTILVDAAIQCEHILVIRCEIKTRSVERLVGLKISMAFLLGIYFQTPLNLGESEINVKIISTSNKNHGGMVVLLCQSLTIRAV
jgi:hypothetical protein